MSDRSLINDMVTKFGRMNEALKLLIVQQKKENVKWADLDALK